MAKDDKAVASILGKLTSKSAEDEAPEGDDYDAGLSTAAGEIVAAVKAGDADALASALKSFVEMCQ